MDYVSLIGAIGGVIAAIYAAMAYYRMRADDAPTVHIRFVELLEGGTYYLVLEICPGKRSARYDVIAVKGGRISPAELKWNGDVPTVFAIQDLRPAYEVNVHVPSSIARDAGPDLPLILSMKKNSVISLRCSRTWFSKRIKATITDSMAVTD